MVCCGQWPQASRQTCQLAHVISEGSNGKIDIREDLLESPEMPWTEGMKYKGK